LWPDVPAELAPMSFKVKTPNRTVVLEIDQPGAEVFVDGNKINVAVMIE
jgi:hypothetical protein